MTTILNNLKFQCQPHLLKFRFEAGTSRGTLTEKCSFFISAFEEEKEQVKGWGEAGPLPKLSEDDIPDFEHRLKELCHRLSGAVIPKTMIEILDWVEDNIPAELPSIRFAFETALLDLMHGGSKKILDNSFFDQEKAIPINGLIWMGDKEFMLDQIDRKLEEGYDCIKMKIGAIDFDQECALLEYIRNRFSPEQITIRVDANGAFQVDQALEKLKRLAAFALHSIEQPIRQGQQKQMKA
ncbi:enolase C-terminal domain-like protein, partial [Cecembia lonarensis]|uniref:enolase C-terminal domain-like protein n=1 Tax=Cecembia lonarensis TaxID=645110 RepID=UPI00058C0971